MTPRLEASPRRATVRVGEPIVLAVKLVNDADQPWTAQAHLLSHGTFPQFVWWEARLGDGRFVTNMPMIQIACPASAEHGEAMGTITLPPKGVLEFEITAENGLQVEPEPPDWVVIGASAARGTAAIVVKDGMFALESKPVRVMVE